MPCPRLRDEETVPCPVTRRRGRRPDSGEGEGLLFTQAACSQQKNLNAFSFILPFNKERIRRAGQGLARIKGRLTLRYFYLPAALMLELTMANNQRVFQCGLGLGGSGRTGRSLSFCCAEPRAPPGLAGFLHGFEFVILGCSRLVANSHDAGQFSFTAKLIKNPGV